MRMMFYMFLGMFLIQYFISSYIMSNQLGNITNSTGKVYMCIIMGLFMIFLDILLNPMMNVTDNIQLFVGVCGLIIVFIYLYRIQFGVNERNYIKEMIEHHSMALLTSKNILEKTKNPAVVNFATKILLTQEKEIEDMRYLLKSI